MTISSDIIRGYNDTIILSTLLSEDSYGYEISQTISEISEENTRSRRQRCIPASTVS